MGVGGTAKLRKKPGLCKQNICLAELFRWILVLCDKNNSTNKVFVVMIRAEVLTVNPSLPTVGALRRLARPIGGTVDLSVYEYTSVHRSPGAMWQLSSLLFSGRSASLPASVALLAIRLAGGVAAVLLGVALLHVDMAAAICLIAGGVSMALGLLSRFGAAATAAGMVIALGAGIFLPYLTVGLAAAACLGIVLLGTGWFAFDFHTGRAWRASLRRATESRRLSYKSFRL